MRNASFSVVSALLGVATLAGCRIATDSPLGHHDWTLGHPKTAAAYEEPADMPPPCRSKCPPAEAEQTSAAVSVDPPASSELVPLPTRPVFGSRMDGRQAGIIEPPLAEAPQPADPPAETIATPPRNAIGAGISLKLRRTDLPSTDSAPDADQ